MAEQSLFLLFVGVQDTEYRRLRRWLQHAYGEAVQLEHCTVYEQARLLIGQLPYDAVLLDGRQTAQAEARWLLEQLRPAGNGPALIALVDGDPGREADWLPYGACDAVHNSTLSSPLLLRALRYALENRRIRQRLFELEHCDALTGLPNRREGLAQLARAAKRAVTEDRLLAVLLFNLDGFGKFNDDMGLAAGDALVVSVAERLRAGLAAGDSLARLGADEFLLVRDGCVTTAEVARMARSLLDGMAAPFVIEDEAVQVHASLGVAVCPEAGQEADTLLRHAQMALRQAKATDLGTYRFYTGALAERVESEARLEADIDKALESEQFLLYYQPRLSLADGRMVGLEGLVRWQHPERGLLPPSVFVPLAEQSGQIVPLGYWVLRQACRDLHALQEEGLPVLPIAVNLSFEQFRDRHFVSTVTDIVRASGVDPALLEFELTETAMMTNPRRADRCMRALAELGLRFSLDDFGTGYSSFAYLQRLPIHCLKIDRSFVQGALDHADDAVIVRAMIHLAHSLGLSVVAEGAERIEHVQFLRKTACDQVQGYVFSPPAPLQRIRAMLMDDARLAI